MPKIRIDKGLYERIRQYAEENGYSSADEFATHVLEEIVDTSNPEKPDEDVMQRLKGLGYIS